MASSKLTGFTSSYAETLTLTFANSSLILSFYALQAIICYCSNISASAVNLATLVLSSGFFSLDNFDLLEDLDSFNVFDLWKVFDAQLLLLLDEPFDLLSSASFFDKYFTFFLKENTWF